MRIYRQSKKPLGRAVLGAVLAAALLAGCARSAPMAGSTGGSAAAAPATAESAAVQTITPEQGKAMLDAGGVTLVDVRTQAEYDEGHIETAILIPNEEIGSEPPALLPDQGAAMIVYCRTGRRSAEAAQKLVDLGYTRVYDMGGIQSWTYGTVQ